MRQGRDPRGSKDEKKSFHKATPSYEKDSAYQAISDDACGGAASRAITVPVTCQGQPAVAVVDQIHAVAKHQLKSKLETMTSDDLAAISKALSTNLEIR